MFHWLAGIVAAVIAGLIVWWFVGQPTPPPPPNPNNHQNQTQPKNEYDPVDSFISSLVHKNTKNPVRDDRLKGAIRKVMLGISLEQGKSLMKEAGYPSGESFYLMLSRFKHKGGSLGEAQMLIGKLRPIGVQVSIIN